MEQKEKFRYLKVAPRKKAPKQVATNQPKINLRDVLKNC